MNTPLSRRCFVERSALTAGLLGAAGLAPGTSHAADSTGSGNVAAVRPTDAREHGAKGDGKSDDTKALQAALDATSSKGPVCYAPPGHYLDQCTDIGRIENVHFNPNFWTRLALKPPFPGGDLKAYLEQNLIGFKIRKTDWEFISNSFVIFPLIGFHFDDFDHGPGNVVVTQSGSDICPVAVQVDRTQPHAGVQFANGQFMSTLEIGPQNRGPVKLANCGFWGTEATREHIRHRGNSTLLLTACHFTGWDHAGKGDPCILAEGGRVVVTGCEFMDAGKRAIRLDKGLKSAAILGCAFRGPQPVEDRSGADVQIGLNTSQT